MALRNVSRKRDSRSSPEPTGGSRKATRRRHEIRRVAARTDGPNRRRKSTSVPEAGVAGVRISHPDRVLYPAQGLTKRDLAEYYASVADRMLPYVADRPIVLVRCPEGAQSECFYQKHFETGVPDALRTISIRESGGSRKYLVVDDVAGLVSLVQLGALEIHLWGSRADDIEKPDQLVFDLDPDTGLPWSRIVSAAELLRDRLTDLGLACFPKTSGGKGIHLVTPLARRIGWTGVRAFARSVAEAVARDDPESFTSVASKQRREGRIFIDYLRNGRGATTVAPYSSRAGAGATVSLPLSWAELGKSRPEQFTVANLTRILARRRRDPWGAFDGERRALPKRALTGISPARGQAGVS
jgi:bifunctional non-homologous end joining protein LigD